MKRIGLLGGMSWESTVPYYQTINRVVREELGSLHSAEIVLLSVDFEQIQKLQHANRWDECGEILGAFATTLESAGADFIVLCTGTMHKVAPDIERATKIPLLHITEATGRAIQGCGLGKVGLLGTRFSMEDSFLRERLQKQFGLEVLIPSVSQRELVHTVIYEELCQGAIRSESREDFVQIINDLRSEGCQGVILGCTEIALLVQESDVSIPVFDIASLHAKLAARIAVGREELSAYR